MTSPVTASDETSAAGEPKPAEAVAETNHGGRSRLRRWVERGRAALGSERARGVFLLAAILTLIGYYKVILSAHTFHPYVDGGYYTGIALHVRDGKGLATNISLFHKGFSHFPHPTGSYPLWLLLYGYTARLFPLMDVAVWMPTCLYFGALVIGYLWASRLFPGSLFPQALPSFNAGHVLVLILGLSSEFFKYTSLPYTEGLAYLVLLAALWRFHSLWPKPSWWGGLEMGLWLGALILVRTQLLLLALAAFPALAYAIAVFKHKRASYAMMAGACLASFSLVILLRYLHLRSFAEQAQLIHVLRYEHLRFTDVLSRGEGIKKADGVWDYLLDRAGGFPVAFGYGGKYSYSKHFYTFQYSVVVALPILLLRGILATSKQNLLSAWNWLRCHTNLNHVFVVVFAVGSFLAIHTFHKGTGGWYFFRRHSLTSVFLFSLSLVFLLRHRRFFSRMLGTLILCSGVFLGGAKIRSVANKRATKVEKPYKPGLIRWLKAEARKKPGLVVAMRHPQLVGWLTPEIGYHWIGRQTTQKDVRTMVTELNADYVILNRRERPERPARTFRRDFKLVGRKSGLRAYRPSPALLSQRRK